MSRPIDVYRRTFKGLIRRARSNQNAIKYPEFKVGDIVKPVNDILDIDARITAANTGYVGEQVRRRMRYRILLRRRSPGKIVEIRTQDIYVKFRVKNAYIRKKYGLDKPMIFRKQMLVLIRST